MIETLNVQERFTVVGKEKGLYHAFPTIIKYQEQLYVAFRSASVNQSQGHGVGGKIRLFHAHLDDLNLWNERTIDFGDYNENKQWNEIDAQLSKPNDNDIYFVTRDYAFNRGSFPYINYWPTEQFFNTDPSISLKASRRKVTELIVNNTNNVSILACFGHIQQTIVGDLLMSCYGVIQGDKYPSPVLLSSNNKGESWSVRSILARSDHEGQHLNEFSIANINKHTWVAALRTEKPPHPLSVLESEDDGVTWSARCELGYCGHAPMLYKESEHSLWLQYRDVSVQPTGIALCNSKDKGKSWQFIGHVAQYSGNPYDGGYGDLISLDNGRLLSLYYLCDNDLSPWIEGVVFNTV